MFSLVFSEISPDIEKIGRNLAVQANRQIFYVSRGFAGGTTLRNLVARLVYLSFVIFLMRSKNFSQFSSGPTLNRVLE